MMLATLDQNMLFGTAVGLSCGFLNVLMPAFFSSTASVAALWIITALVFLCNKKTRQCGLALLLAIALTYVVGDAILKDLVMRERPFIVYGVSELLISKPPSYSFPSGHAGSSFAALTVIFSMYKKMRIPASVYALLIAFSRVYLFVHFPSDVLAGALLGIGCGYAVMALMRRFSAPRALYEMETT